MHIDFFFDGDFDQDRLSIRILDGNGVESGSLGGWRCLATSTLLDGSGHETFKVDIFFSSHFL